MAERGEYGCEAGTTVAFRAARGDYVNPAPADRVLLLERRAAIGVNIWTGEPDARARKMRDEIKKENEKQERMKQSAQVVLTENIAS